MNPDTYEKLRQSTPEDRLRATVQFYKVNSAFVAGIKLGFALAQPDGWRHVAPAWLRGVREGEKTGR